MLSAVPTPATVPATLTSGLLNSPFSSPAPPRASKPRLVSVYESRRRDSSDSTRKSEQLNDMFVSPFPAPNATDPCSDNPNREPANMAKISIPLKRPASFPQTHSLNRIVPDMGKLSFNIDDVI